MKNGLPWLMVSLVSVGLHSASLRADEHAYVGTKKCKVCHLKEWRSWTETNMAKAFDKLKPGVAAEAKTRAGLDPNKDYTADAECVRCHSTGHGQPGGFVSLEKTPDLTGVGCEVCHGPGGTYTKPEHMSLKNKNYKKADLVAVGLVDTVAVEQCKGCHNTDSPFVGDDYVFDFETNKGKGTHEQFPLKYEH